MHQHGVEEKLVLEECPFIAFDLLLDASGTARKHRHVPRGQLHHCIGWGRCGVRALEEACSTHMGEYARGVVRGFTWRWWWCNRSTTRGLKQ